jgi:protein-S-isoprenylcysteine O-methyltransferase Ste14
MEGRRLNTFAIAQILAVGALLWILISRDQPWNAPRYAGTILVGMGAAMLALARYQLGKSFSFKAEARQLVTTGLYSKIRNPIYVAGLIMIVGAILALQKPVLWIVLAVVVIAQTVRARREAQVLEAAFGDSYREYRRKTWF